jgi:predicted alpha/beta-fold hydrolase
MIMKKIIGGPNKGPLVILLHGLSGSSSSTYILGLQDAINKLGWRSVALNFRGCSGTPNHKARSYHSGKTEDIHFLYQLLRKKESQTSGLYAFSPSLQS